MFLWSTPSTCLNVIGSKTWSDCRRLRFCISQEEHSVLLSRWHSVIFSWTITRAWVAELLWRYRMLLHRRPIVRVRPSGSTCPAQPFDRNQVSISSLCKGCTTTHPALTALRFHTGETHQTYIGCLTLGVLWLEQTSIKRPNSSHPWLFGTYTRLTPHLLLPQTLYSVLANRDKGLVKAGSVPIGV